MTVNAEDHDHEPSPLEQVVDLFVHLPVGFALEFRRTAPQFIARGRQELAHGRAVAAQALHPKKTRHDGRLGRVSAHAVGTLRALGVLPGPEPSGDAAVAGPVADVGGDGATVTAAGTTGAGPSATWGDAPGVTTSAPGAPDRTTGPGIDPETLAIPDYDSLSASQVVPRLDSLAGEELETVRRYEVGTRGRKTILNKIAQLQAG